MLHCCVAMSQVPVAIVCLSAILGEGKACAVRAAARRTATVDGVRVYILESWNFG